MSFRFSDCQSIYINSKYRLNPATETSSDFTYEIKLENKNYNHFCVQSISIPKSYYCFHQPHTQFQLREDNVNYTITLAQGNYSFQLLKTELQNLLNEATSSSYTYVMSIPNSSEVQTGRLTFTISGNSGVQPSLIFPNTDLAQILGFLPGTYTFSGDQLTSPNIVQLQKNENLLLCSSLIKGSLSSKPVICQIYMGDVPDFSIKNWYCPDIQGYSRPLSHHAGVYKFQILDRDGEVINLNGINIGLNILFFEKDNTSELLKQSLLIQNYESLANK